MRNQIQQRAAVLNGQARADGEGAELLHGHAVAHVAWHGRGDYFASVAPTGNTQARSPDSWHLVEALNSFSSLWHCPAGAIGST